MMHGHHVVHVSTPAAYSHSHHHVSTPAMTHSHHHGGGHHQHQQHSGGHHHHHHNHGQRPAALPGFPVPYEYQSPALALPTVVAPVLEPTPDKSDYLRVVARLFVMGLMLVGVVIFVFVLNRISL